MVPHATPETEMLGEFMDARVSLESGLRAWASWHSLTGQVRGSVLHNMKFLQDAGILEKNQIAELNHIRQVRNVIIHGQAEYKHVLTSDLIKRVKYYAYVFDENEA